MKPIRAQWQWVTTVEPLSQKKLRDSIKDAELQIWAIILFGFISINNLLKMYSLYETNADIHLPKMHFSLTDDCLLLVLWVSPVLWSGCRTPDTFTLCSTWLDSPWNGQWGAESHHYGPYIILSLACVLRCHLTSHLLHPSPVPGGVWAREWHHFLALLLCIIFAPISLHRTSAQQCSMYGQEWSFSLQPVAAVTARECELTSTSPDAMCGRETCWVLVLLGICLPTLHMMSKIFSMTAQL